MYDIKHLAGGPEKWVHMESLIEYSGKHRRAWAVPGETWQARLTLLQYLEVTRTCLLSEKGGGHGLLQTVVPEYHHCCSALVKTGCGREVTNAN